MSSSLPISDADAATARQIGFSQWTVALRRTLMTTPLGWAVAAWFCWGRVPATQFSLWLATFIVMWAGGLWVLQGVIRQGSRIEIHKNRALMVSMMDGVAWGLMVWMVMGYDPTLDTALMTLLFGVSAVNAQVYVTFVRAYYLQIFSLWLVMMFGLMRIADQPQAVDYLFGMSVFFGLTVYYMRGIGQRVAEGIALQLANASLTEQLRVALQSVRLDAATDALTGQGNRRALDELLKQQVALANQTGHPFSVLMLDIDFFKKVNDVHGHMVGDDALRAFSQRVHEYLRQGDVCARFGGEEFVAVLPSATLETAIDAAERLRHGVEASPLLTNPLVAITTSIGVATWRPGQTEDDLLNAADAAVYAAKRGGRNQVRH